MSGSVGRACRLGRPDKLRPKGLPLVRGTRRVNVGSALVVLLLVAAAATHAAEITPADIDTSVAALADYTSAKNPAALEAVRDLVRRTHGKPAVKKHLALKLAALLTSGSTDECKLFVCQQLWILGTAESIGALEKMLVDRKTAHMARYAIGNDPSPPAAEALRRAMTKARGMPLVGIINLLGERRDAPSAAALIEHLASADAAVAEVAAAALGKIGGPKAADALAKARKTKIRTAATDAYLQCAATLARQGDRKRAAAIYKELFAPSETRLIRRAAMIGMMDTGGDAAAELILATLRGKDRVLRATAIARIPEMKGEGLTGQFAAELPKLPAPTQVLLIGALADRGGIDVARALVASARSDHAEVRTAAVAGLGKVGDAACVPILAQAAAEGRSDAEKKAALVSLRSLSGEGVDAAIVKSMSAAKPDPRAELIHVLHDRNAVGAAEALLQQAASPDEKISKAAFRALVRLSRPKDLTQLIALLTALRGDAERAVTAACRKIPDRARCADAVLSALSTAKQTPVRCSLLRVLGAVANYQALSAVRAALKSGPADVTDTAVRVLAAWPDVTAAGDLLTLLGGSPAEVHRVLALRGLVRMTTLVPAGGQTLRWLAQAGKAAKNADQRKLVLSGLATVRRAEALDAAVAYLDDATVQAEAAAAAVSIAEGLATSPHRGRIAAAMAKVIAVTKDAALRKRATQAAQAAKISRDFITTWEFAGPYLVAGKECTQLYDVVFPPERPGAPNVKWRPLPAGTDAASPWAMDLAAVCGGPHRVAYVRTTIHSDAARGARLELGKDDGIKAWLNGKVVLNANVAGALVAGSDKAPVQLVKGANVLLLKVTQHSGPWSFCARLCSPGGKPLKGIRVAGTRPTAPPPATAKRPAGIDFDKIQPVRLFDGKTFAGWEGDQTCFRVAEGAIVAGRLGKPIPRSAYLCTKEAHGDFELRLLTRLIGKGANGGIQFRAARVAGKPAMTGYQADMADGHYWGCLYGGMRPRILVQVDQPALSKVVRPGDWNEYIIRCEGTRIRLWVNGYLTVDYTELDKRMPLRGLFGLQTHAGPPGEGWYKDITIKPVPPAKRR